MRRMKDVFVVAVVVALAAAGCNKLADNACCETDAQCQQLGVSAPRPCGDGRACSDGLLCVAAECLSNTDCAASPDRPICDRKLCVAACTSDPECTQPGLDRCNTSTGTCVECLSNSDCSGDTNVCDAQTSSCRGCIADTECPSGVCNEAANQCVADGATVIYVKTGGADTGACTAAAPCASLTYAATKVTPSRSYIHLDATTLPAAATAVTFANGTVIVDGTGTVVSPTATDSAAITMSNSNVTLMNLTLAKPSTKPVLAIAGQAQLFAVTLTGELDCANATLAIVGSRLHQGAFVGDHCTTTARRSRFDDFQFHNTAGTSIIRDCVITQSDNLQDAMVIEGAASRFDFNTVVSTSSTVSDGLAVSCAGASASNNVFAYASMHPTGGCVPTYSLYDTATLALPAGAGDKLGDAASFFVDRAAGDYHLRAGSPAIGAGSAVVGVDVDFDGHPRPNPVGSAPDMGAFEAAQ